MMESKKRLRSALSLILAPDGKIRLAGTPDQRGTLTLSTALGALAILPFVQEDAAQAR